MSQDSWFEQLADATRDEGREAEPAPASLKSRIYSAMVNRLSETGPLLDLAETKAGGQPLCVFEEALCVLPLGSRIRSMNPCRICHARVLGERMDHAPIFWPACPYSEFHRR
jgi:hypothetical protein